MAGEVSEIGLSFAESGALALSDAARALDHAEDAPSFLRALEFNRQIWQTLAGRMADRRLADYALDAAERKGAGVNDQHIQTLIDINRRVSAELAGGGDVEHIRSRAYFIWESRGRPHGQDLDHWLLAEMEADTHKDLERRA